MILISEKCYYYKDNKQISYASKFYYYLNNNHENIEKICINFHSTNQIKNWIQKTLSDLYNDIDLKFGDLDIQQCPPLTKYKYESIKRRISNPSLSIPSSDV
jgi:disulfide oxidoreductase YuzD